MAAFDFDTAVRWARFEPGRTLARRPDSDLPFLPNDATPGPGLLLDTCVYIDGLQGRTPEVVAGMMDLRPVNHSTVALQELMHTVGVLDPQHPGSAMAIRQIGLAIEAMPAYRTFASDTDVLGRAALLSGMLCRLQGYGGDRRLKVLQDCVLFLQAQKLGLTVLTANIADFDYLLQLVPAGRVLFYRRA